MKWLHMPDLTRLHCKIFEQLSGKRLKKVTELLSFSLIERFSYLNRMYRWPQLLVQWNAKLYQVWYSMSTMG